MSVGDKLRKSLRDFNQIPRSIFDSILIFMNKWILVS